MSIALAKSEVEMSSSTSPSAPFAFGNGASGEANQVQDTPLTIKKSHGFTSSAKKESTTTPRTEASTPGSNADELDLEDDDVDVAMNDNALHRALKNCDSKDAKDEDLQHDGEMPLSQTDQHIHQLDRDGELNEVAGSQSLLSQELLYHNMDGSGSEYGDEDRNLLLSQETESSLSMAKRIGLLSSTQDEESDNEEDGKPAAQEPSTPKRSAGGFSLLSRSISSGAPDLASFSAKKEVIASEGKPRMDITDTPVRESEGFGSLLDAVAKITEQEGSEGEDALAWRRASYLAPPDTFEDIEQDMSSSPTRRKRSATAKRSAASLSPTRKSPRKPVLKRKIPMALPSSGTIKKRKTSQSIQKRKSKTENSDRKKATQSKKKMDDAKEAQLAAKRAAALAERAITDPVLAKRLLLSMALVRENPRSAPEVLPGAGHIIVEGFVWAHYPPLEIVLKKHMAEYYELSTTKCQSAQQQSFNNDMVAVVKEVAGTRNWEFAECFDDKALRDRIRCYYKTHIQNAKKRLRTMVRNPTKRANSKHLLQHLEIIEQHKVDEEKQQQQKRQRSGAKAKESLF